MNAKAGIWVVIPVKRFSTAKSRLATVLDSLERAQLARLMFEDVLDALRPCKDFLAGAIVATSDESAIALARRAAATIVSDLADNGINAAIKLAVTRIDRRRDDGVIVIPSDIPQLSPDDIFQAAATISERRVVTIVKATQDGGTNLLACRPADVIAPQFGPQSFDRHCRAASRAGIKPHVLAAPRIKLDIDRPENLRTFLALKTNTRTHVFLTAIDVAKRLEQRLRHDAQQVHGDVTGALS
jgi:2-phospho-L-lactate/phosphoenolpyruvate guanylyltransferase